MRARIHVVAGAFVLAVLVPPSPAQCDSEELQAGDSITFDGFGGAVAIRDGVAAVGAPATAGATTASGAVYVFEEVAGDWTLQAKLFPLDGADGDEFGMALAIDGDTIVVGAPASDEAAFGGGLVYVFVRDGTSWALQQKLGVVEATPFDRVGASVAIDGDTVAVGAPGTNSPDNNRGLGYVFVRTGTEWTRQARLFSSDGAGGDQLGYSIALDGDTIVAGAILHDAAGDNAGAAYVYARTGTLWDEEAKLVASDGADNDWAGFAVAVDSGRAFVGAFLDDDFGSASGSVYVFNRAGGRWYEAQKLNGSAEDGADLFGSALAATEGRLIVGAYHGGDVQPFAGAAYVFERAATRWVEMARLTPGTGSAWDEYGRSVGIDGVTAIVGAPRDENGATGAGSADTFTLLGLWAAYCESTVNSSGQSARMHLTGELGVAANDLTLGCSGCPSGVSGLFFYGPESAQLPFGDGFLCVSPFAPGMFRIQPLVQADASGTVTRRVDLTALPAQGSIAPGSTWNFQLWFRDVAAGGSGFNLSDGLHASFCP